MFISILRTALFVLLFATSAQALAAPPTVTTSPATGITSSSAVLNGIGTPNGEATTGRFRYSSTNPGTCNDTFGTRVPTISGTDLGMLSAPVPYSITTTGLSPGVTYYFCAIVTNASGTALGAVLSFTIPSTPVVTTTSATMVTSSSVTLNGGANPLAAVTTGWFRYSSTDPGACNDTFGSRTPTSGGVNLGSGITSTPFAQAITGVLPGVTYYFCAIANNSYGTGFGAVLTFTTPATAPTVTTSSATNLTRTTGTLTGYVNPGGDPTTAWFRYSTASPGTCNNTFGTRAPATGGSVLGAGTSTTAFSQAITGLTQGVTYYYCAIAANSIGTSWGAVYTFVTPLAPTAVTMPAASVTINSATLQGTGNPNRSAATGWFRYSTTDPGSCNTMFGSAAPVTGGTALGSDITDQYYSQPITGLSGGTTYYYCAIVASTEGTALGAVLTFTTSGPPTVVTTAATSVTATSTYLNGAGNPNGANAYGWFRYATTDPGSCSDTFGTRAPSSGYTNLGYGNASVAYSQSTGSLLPATTYYYCAITNNTYGNGFGTVLSFTTPATAPTVNSGSASNLTRTTGVLNGYANPGGIATTAWFRYSTSSPGTCNDTFGTRAPATGGAALSAGSSTVSFNQAITGLTQATTYYYCALATNAMGAVVGAVYTFITPSAPTATTGPASSLTINSATLNGSGNPNRSATTGWFRYSTTDPGSCNNMFGSPAPVTGGTSLGSDIFDQGYSQPITGLSSGTTYYYCAIVVSSEGMALGSVVSFTTSGTSTAVTTAATSVTSTTAYLNGTGNPNGAAAYGWFRYSTTNPGSCSDTFGSRAPSSGYTNLGYGTTSTPFSQQVTGLLPGVTYYYCAIANNSYGTGFGGLLTFATPAMAPTVNTGSASSLTRTTGVLNGSANPGGDATSAWFRYSLSSPGTCNDTFGTRAPATGGSVLGAGTSNVAFSQAITGLTPATTYYYCAIATNSIGLVWGTVYSFVTPSVPTATTGPASNLTTSSASLNGSGNPNRATATGWFRYAATNPGTCDDKFGSRAPLTGGTGLGSDIFDQGYTQPITGLSSGTTYYYCAIVVTTEGTAFGSVVPFTTSGTSTAVTTAATSVTSTTAYLNGTGNPNGAAAYGWFRYATTSPGACSDTFGARAPSSGYTNLGSSTTSTPFSQQVTGLLPGVTYYYCAIANNTYGTGFGALLTFTTPAMAPTVNTGSASSLTRTTGVLNGYANPGGDNTTAWFRYSLSSPGTCNDTFGTRAPATGGTALGSGSSAVSFSQAITGLTQATTYYYCALASNTVGSVVGTVYTFVTPSAPTATTLPGSNLTNNTAQLNGSGNPNRATATGWFRYSTTNPGTCNNMFGSPAPVTGGNGLGGDIFDQVYAQTITGLSSGTTYYYCAIVASTEGTAFGAVVSFTTAGAPTALTTAATSVTATTVTLNGAANPNGANAYGWFRYSATDPGTCNDTFGTRAPNSGYTTLGYGNTSVPFTQSLTNLLPATIYYYCTIANNTYGNGFGAVLTFTTPAMAPLVTTSSATSLTRTTGVLTGYANPGGDATTAWFRYSTASPGTCNDTFGTRAPATGGLVLGSGNTTMPFTQAITGLTQATTYYYCAIAANSVGTTWGAVVVFITPLAPTALSLPASNGSRNFTSPSVAVL